MHHVTSSTEKHNLKDAGNAVWRSNKGNVAALLHIMFLCMHSCSYLPDLVTQLYAAHGDEHKQHGLQTVMTSSQRAGGGTNFNIVKLHITAMFNRVQLMLWKMVNPTDSSTVLPTVKSTVK
jgi:hypothetical protein